MLSVGVLDDGEDVRRRAVQGGGGEEVAGQNGVGLAAQERGHVCRSRSGAGSIPLCFRISHTVEGATLIPSAASSPRGFFGGPTRRSSGPDAGREPGWSGGSAVGRAAHAGRHRHGDGA